MNTNFLSEFRVAILALLAVLNSTNSPVNTNESVPRSVRRAKRIIAEELRRRGWTEDGLGERRKIDLDKLALAARLRRETTHSHPDSGQSKTPFSCDKIRSKRFFINNGGVLAQPGWRPSARVA